MKFKEFFYLEEKEEVNLKKVGPLDVEFPDEATGIVSKQNISNILFGLTGGEEKLFLKIWTLRKRDKKENGRIVARKGDVVTAHGKLGACNKDISGVGSPLGGPEERLDKYELITMCCLRNGKYTTRHFSASNIFKISVAGKTYNVT